VSKSVSFLKKTFIFLSFNHKKNRSHNVGTALSKL
jgi:hypothetical protein